MGIQITLFELPTLYFDNKLKYNPESFHIRTVHLDIINVYSPTDGPVNCLKNNIKIYITNYIKTAPTCLGAVTPSSGSVLIRAY